MPKTVCSACLFVRPARLGPFCDAWLTEYGCVDTGYIAPSAAERESLDELRRRTFAHVLSWSEEEGTASYVGSTANRVVSKRITSPLQP